MFILQAKDVKPCSVIKKGSKELKSRPGVAYRGHLFVRVASYPQNESKLAIKQCRQLLEKEIPITTIIVKTAKSITLWSHDRRLQIVKPAQKKNSTSKQVESSKQTKGMNSLLTLFN